MTTELDLGKVELYWARTEEPTATFDALVDIGYLEAPASKGHHLAEPGGLVKHSMRVADHLIETRAVSDVSAYRIGMYHDLVK